MLPLAPPLQHTNTPPLNIFLASRERVRAMFYNHSPSCAGGVGKANAHRGQVMVRWRCAECWRVAAVFVLVFTGWCARVHFEWQPSAHTIHTHMHSDFRKVLCSTHERGWGNSTPEFFCCCCCFSLSLWMFHVTSAAHACELGVVRWGWCGLSDEHGGGHRRQHGNMRQHVCPDNMLVAVALAPLWHYRACIVPRERQQSEREAETVMMDVRRCLWQMDST